MGGKRRKDAVKPAVRVVPILPARDAVHFPTLIATLQVVREPSRRALRKALDGERMVLVLSQRDMGVEEPGASDLYRVGTLSETLQALPMPDASLRATLRGLRRARVLKVVNRSGALWAEIEELAEVDVDPMRGEALRRACLDSFAEVVRAHRQIPVEALDAVAHIQSPGELADAVAHHLPLQPAWKQDLLERLDVGERLDAVFEALGRESEILRLDAAIREQVESRMGTAQRDFYLREQLRAIQEELRDPTEQEGAGLDLADQVRAAGMPTSVEQRALAEVSRLDRLPPGSSEGAVSRDWIECLLALPWNVSTDERLDLAAAAAQLDADHFGLRKVKERVLDYLAVRQLTRSIRGPILCFAGPPGVGKTSIGRSIAEAMGRRFCRISLGGVRDEADIRGHRRTYVGAMPGRIVQALRHAGTRNPVMMLDELDKLGSDWRGDPTSALLEALDPEQNARFEDHYVDAPFDLSSVMFIATANVPEAIPVALRDRLEIIPFPGYTDAERIHIAERFLIPKALAEHGLASSGFCFSGDAVEAMTKEYTKEAGVRDLERQIAAACRKAARETVEGKRPKAIDASTLKTALGPPRHLHAAPLHRDEVGAATGLVVADYGGDVVRVEASLMPPASERPELRLTGRLGDVMKESAEAAVTFVRANHERLSKGAAFRFDIHVHVPDAGVSKDGPSAGLTIAVALASAFSGRAVRKDVAMTGEITLRGRVLPVGGVREKVLAAVRAGMADVVLPRANERDAAEIAKADLGDLRIHFVETVDETLAIALRAEATALAWI